MILLAVKKCSGREYFCSGSRMERALNERKDSGMSFSSKRNHFKLNYFHKPSSCR